MINITDINYNLNTGLNQMLIKYPDSDKIVDQFIIRFINEDENQLTSERCVRLKNGHLSTEREAIEWEKRNNLIKDRYVKDFMKKAGVHLNADKNIQKLKPNDICTCGTNKKI